VFSKNRIFNKSKADVNNIKINKIKVNMNIVDFWEISENGEGGV